MSHDDGGGPHVIVVGGGFAGVGCVKRLARETDVRVTLIDRHNYHQFQPLLYQVATSQLASSDIAFSLRKLFRRARERRREARRGDRARPGHPHGHARRRASASPATRSCSPRARSRTSSAPPAPRSTRSRSTRSTTRRGCARGSSRCSRRPTAIPGCIDQGALTFVVVGGGPTGVELAGALADLIAETMTVEYHDLAVTAAQIHLVDLGHTLLGPFSDRAHDYAAKVLGRKGVRLHLGVAVTEVGAGHVSLADGSTIRTRCVVWGGGIKAPPVAASGGPPARPRRADRRPAGPVGRGRRRRLRGRATSPTSRARTATPIRSWARSPCRAAPGPPRTSWPTPPASRASRSTTTTRASWR